MALSILWALLGVIFVISELFVPGTLFFLGFFYGCLVACILAVFGLSLIAQLIHFLIISCVFYTILLRHFRKRKTAIKNDPYISPLDALIGQEIIIHTQIEYNNIGYALINGLEWRVQWSNKHVIHLPQRAQIVAIKGAHLKVIFL